MSKMIFVNLPVADLPAAKAFYEAIGLINNPQFTDETAACMVFTDTIHVMLLTHEKFAQFTDKRIADAHATSEVLIASPPTAARASTRSPTRRSPPAAASRARSRITASCIRAPSRIWTAISGSRCTWTWTAFDGGDGAGPARNGGRLNGPSEAGARA